MEVESSSSNRSYTTALFVQIKKIVAILSIITFLVLEIYACYSLTHLYGGGKINTQNFSCDKNIDISNTLHVNICNKLISIFQNWNNTVKAVTISDDEWFMLAQLLR